MAKVIDKRMAAEMDGGFVVFLIGMRVNKPWKLHKWIPVLLAMPKMLKELEGRSDLGFLGHHGLGPVITQYWRSFKNISKHTLAAEIKNTGPRGSILISAWETAVAMSASGTKPTSSRRAIMKPSIAACHPPA